MQTAFLSMWNLPACRHCVRYAVMCVHVPRHSLPANRTLVAGEAPVNPLGAVSGWVPWSRDRPGRRSGCGPALGRLAPTHIWVSGWKKARYHASHFRFRCTSAIPPKCACVFLNTALVCRRPQLPSLEVAAALPGATHRKEGWDNYMKLGHRG